LLYNIIIQEIKRYRLYCRNDIDFLKVLNLYKQRLYDRGYKPSTIDKYFEKDRIPTRESLINNLIQPTRSAESKNAETPIIVVVQLPTLRQPINLKDTFAIPPVLYNHARFKLAYNNINLIIGKKNNRSLGKYLLHRPTISENSLHQSGGKIPLMEGTTAL
jgi:DNA-binding transcriptional MerR regulator